jgi:hypothetical protein
MEQLLMRGQDRIGKLCEERDALVMQMSAESELRIHTGRWIKRVRREYFRWFDRSRIVEVTEDNFRKFLVGLCERLHNRAILQWRIHIRDTGFPKERSSFVSHFKVALETTDLGEIRQFRRFKRLLQKHILRTKGKNVR